MNNPKSGFTTSQKFTTVPFSGQRHLLPSRPLPDSPWCSSAVGRLPVFPNRPIQFQTIWVFMNIYSGVNGLVTLEGWIDAKDKVSWGTEVTQWGPVDEPPSWYLFWK